MTSGRRLVRVLLADDNLPVRLGLKHLIARQPDMEVVAETSEGREALQLAQTLSPDVALVDVSMPRWDGVRLARAMSSACPSMKVIAVTRHDDGGFVQKMLEAGACGYVLKQNATSTLVNAVRKCMAGGAYVDAGVKVSAPTSARAVAAMPIVKVEHQPLTTIEDDVLRLFGTALSLQQVATRLGLERQEVTRVRDAAMRKLGIATRLQAINYVRSRNPDATS